MDEKIKRKWVKALRSGEYKQTTDLYHHDGSYCCLGVLCLLIGEDPDTDPNMKVFWERCGLEMDDSEDLADLNDSGATFDQIAMCIENGL